jgi:hypothetical protein
VSDSTERHVSPHVRACLTGDSGVLMDVRCDRIYSLDRVGATIWGMFAAGRSVQTIAGHISSVHGAPASLVLDDVRRFLVRLEQDGLIVRSDPGVHGPSRPVRGPLNAATRQIVAPGDRTLLARAVWRLLRVDVELSLRGFSRLYQSVADHPTRAVACADSIVAAVCRAMDRACAVYPRQALCLQRSAATTGLLRDYGVPAVLVVGARKHPFRAHAWVEVGGLVVNDKRGVKDYYDELDRL